MSLPPGGIPKNSINITPHLMLKSAFLLTESSASGTSSHLPLISLVYFDLKGFYIKSQLHIMCSLYFLKNPWCSPLLRHLFLCLHLFFLLHYILLSCFIIFMDSCNSRFFLPFCTRLSFCFSVAFCVFGK